MWVSVLFFLIDPSVDNVFALRSVIVHNADLVNLVGSLSPNVC